MTYLKRYPESTTLFQEDQRLIYRYDAEEVCNERWGHNAFRVRATKTRSTPTENWALHTPTSSTPQISLGEHDAKSTNGKITATRSKRGKIMMHNSQASVPFALSSAGLRTAVEQPSDWESGARKEHHEFYGVFCQCSGLLDCGGRHAG
ncbi:uncharacterized protein L3040_007581 [Drepanopeziza brunnea f. sp. 'multigermtubi']|uniref:uncharacterized protein n=1 Tax=Drepanopeziza brunnea f. sp. 'multigermtubi' TaxID=698441 RepID=UPI0023A22D94|nr:hypothetical protein L3040_007581 [Drepanopeziza brunnea f. sp. 'multigermtubi']